MTNKMTKVQYLETLKAVVAGEEVAVSAEDMTAFIDHEIELLRNKSAKSGMTATQKANEETKAIIRETLASLDRAVTITELQEADSRLAELKNQKISALLRLMGEKGSGEVVKTYVKKVAYFALAE